MTDYKCSQCGKPCELIEVDHGGYEECWGAMVWNHQYTDVTDCCQVEDYEKTNQ